MLTENQINALPERIYQRLNAINTEYLESIGKVIKDIGELRPSDVHRLQQMRDYGANADDIARKLAQASEKNIAEIYEIFDIVAKENYDYAKPFYDAKEIPYIPFEENEKLQSYVRSLAKQTVGEYVNLTQHTAFAVFGAGNTIAPLFEASKGKVATSLSDTYTKVIDYAVTKVQLGVTDYNSAMRSAVKSLADSGIRTVDYASGYSRRLDTAVRQNILWGVKQCNQNTADMIGEDFGADGYEISYHSHPRPSHEKMGGRQYAKGKARRVKGVYYPSFEDEAEPLLEDYGCLHFKFSILLGISRPAYSESQLAEFKAEDRKTFEFEGKQYTKYEASQLQRKIETEVRHQKDRAVLAKASGDDDLRREAQYKINLLTSKYDKLSKASGLPTKMERMRVDGFRSVKVKTVDKSPKSGIIKSQGGRIMNINNIDSPIEQRNTGKGNPNAILMFDRPLNNRQQKLLNALQKYDARVTVAKKSVNMKDLAALTAVTGDEFAMFTKGSERLIIRGNKNSVNIDVKQALELNSQGYKWSGHTHPGIGNNCLQASPGDYEILRCFNQKVAYIYNSQGNYLEFERK